MNEKIKELQTEAYKWANGITLPYNYNDTAISWHRREAFNKKFAEFLIQECYETIKKDMELAHIQLIPIDFEIYANGRLRRIFKEHFGVGNDQTNAG